MTRLIQSGGSIQALTGAEILDGIRINLGASQNDWAPIDIPNASCYLINPLTSGLSITGITNARQGRVLRLFNAQPVGGNAITIANSSGSSAVNHQIYLGGSNITLNPQTSIDLMGAANETGWTLSGSSSGSGGGGGSSTTPVFSSSVTDNAPGASQNNYAPTGYVGGTTNRLLVQAAAGGTTLTGLSASGVPDGWTILLKNTSSANAITLDNQNAGSSAANRFALESAANYNINPGAARLLSYIAGSGWSVLSP
jgi:hypothetical protein